MGIAVGSVTWKAVWIIGAVFDISGEPSDVDSALRDLHRANIDLTAMRRTALKSLLRMA
jgi:hypothetical protein